MSTDLIDVTDVSITNSCLGTDDVLVNAGVVLLDKYVKIYLPLPTGKSR